MRVQLLCIIKNLTKRPFVRVRADTTHAWFLIITFVCESMHVFVYVCVCVYVYAPEAINN